MMSLPVVQDAEVISEFGEILLELLLHAVLYRFTKAWLPVGELTWLSRIVSLLNRDATKLDSMNSIINYLYKGFIF